MSTKPLITCYYYDCFLLKNDLSHHNLNVEDASELALERPL